MKQFIFGVLILTLVTVMSCNNDDGLGPIILEPITFLMPDTTTVSGFPGNAISLKTQLTTDRIIDSLVIRYHIDSMNQGFDAESDPTFLYEVVKWPVDDNIQIYEGSYTIPQNLEAFDVVRLVFKLRAKERFYEKIFKINVK